MNPGPAVFLAAAAVLTAVMLAPVVATLAAVPPAAAVAALAAGAGRAALGTSALASLAAVAAAALLGVPAGYALARLPLRAGGAVLSLLALPLAFPPVAGGIMLLELVGRRAPLGAAMAQHGLVFVDTFWGVALAEFFVAGSLVAITSTAAFAAVDPTLEEAAMMLGAGPLRIFSRIALPLAAPGILAGILLAWMRAIGEYGATSIVAYHPASLPVQLYVTLSAQGVEPALALAYGFIVMAAVVLAAQWALRRRVV